MALDTFTLDCEAVALQLRLQADGLDLELVKPLPFYKFVIRDQRDGDQAREIVARCLPDTWSLYEQRLFAVASNVDLLIVQSHNAVAPLPVLSLENGHYYTAGTIPAIKREKVTRRNAGEQRLVLSMLALGLEAGEMELKGMSERSRKRYRTMLQDYLKPRPGRARSL